MEVTIVKNSMNWSLSKIFLEAVYHTKLFMQFLLFFCSISVSIDPECWTSNSSQVIKLLMCSLLKTLKSLLLFLKQICLSLTFRRGKIPFFFFFIHYSIFFIRKKWTVFVKAYDVSSSRVRNIYTSDQGVTIARSFCYSTYLIFAVLGFVCAFSPSLAFPRYFFTSGNSFTNYIQFLLLKYICVKNYQFISADFLWWVTFRVFYWNLFICWNLLLHLLCWLSGWFPGNEGK